MERVIKCPRCGSIIRTKVCKECGINILVCSKCGNVIFYDVDKDQVLPY